MNFIYEGEIKKIARIIVVLIILAMVFFFYMLLTVEFKNPFPSWVVPGFLLIWSLLAIFILPNVFFGPTDFFLKLIKKLGSNSWKVVDKILWEDEKVIYKEEIVQYLFTTFGKISFGFGPVYLTNKRIILFPLTPLFIRSVYFKEQKGVIYNFGFPNVNYKLKDLETGITESKNNYLKLNLVRSIPLTSKLYFNNAKIWSEYIIKNSDNLG